MYFTHDFLAFFYVSFLTNLKAFGSPLLLIPFSESDVVNRSFHELITDYSFSFAGILIFVGILITSRLDGTSYQVFFFIEHQSQVISTVQPNHQLCHQKRTKFLFELQVGDLNFTCNEKNLKEVPDHLFNLIIFVYLLVSFTVSLDSPPCRIKQIRLYKFYRYR